MGEEPLNVGLAPRLGLWLPGAAPGQGWEQGWEGSLALPTTLLPCVYYHSVWDMYFWMETSLVTRAM